MYVSKNGEDWESPAPAFVDMIADVEHDDAIFEIIKHGNPVAVVISFDLYEELKNGVSDESS